jgi:hypothetical protein
MAQTTKYLIFDASTEHDSFVGVVECTPEYLARIKKRMALATKAQEEDEDLAWMQFSDSADLYERSKTVDNWLEAASNEEFDDTRMLVTDFKPEFHDSDRVRVSLTYMQVDESACFWVIHPKHSDQVCESQLVRADMELFAE